MKFKNSKIQPSYFSDMIKKINYTLIQGTLINFTTLVRVKCDKGHIFEKYPSSVVRSIKSGNLVCSECILISKRDEFLNKCKDVHMGRYIYHNVQFFRGKDLIGIECSSHGIFYQRVDHHLNGHGCKFCNMSKGELTIKKILDINGINYQTEKTFKDLKSAKGQYLRFDFFLLEQNTIIEYNGKQHYMPIDYFGGEDQFTLNKINDETKSKYCIDNNINFIVMKFDEDIEFELNNILYEKGRHNRNM